MLITTVRTTENVYILLGQRVDKLWQNVALHHGFSEVVVVVGQPAECQRCCLLYARDSIQQQRSQ